MFLAAEILISPRSRPRNLATSKSRRVFGRRDFHLTEMEMIKISTAKNAPRLVARSRRDENHGGQKRGEISGEMSVR